MTDIYDEINLRVENIIAEMNDLKAYMEANDLGEDVYLNFLINNQEATIENIKVIKRLIESRGGE